MNDLRRKLKETLWNMLLGVLALFATLLVAIFRDWSLYLTFSP
jgi:hypothetical protein